MKIALVGSGKIVMSCLDALSQADGVTAHALCVLERNLAKAQALQQQYGIQRIYTDYQALLKDTEADFIYLGIPNNQHYAYARDALLANRHVICEKPFTSSYAETRELVELAKTRQLFLFEAITSIHTPGFQHVQAHLNQLGDIKLVQCNYSQYSSRYNDYVNGKIHAAFDPAMSGGALYDINLYNVYVVCGLFGRPTAVHYECNKGVNGIDTSGVLQLQYPGFIAVCSGAKDSASPGHVTVQGTRGYARITDTPNVCKSIELALDGKLTSIKDTTELNHMVHEFEAFEHCFAAGELDRCHQLLDLALIVADVLEQGRRSAGIRFTSDDRTA